MTHICVRKLSIIDSDNGLSPSRRQAIICTNAGILLIRTLGTNFIEILSEFLTFWFKKMRLNVSSAKRRLFCLGLNVLNRYRSDSNRVRSLGSMSYKVNDNTSHQSNPRTCVDIWGLCWQKQASQAGISNYIPQFTVGCNHLSLTEIPAAGNKALIC